MPKRAGVMIVVLGAVLIASALLLFFYNGYQSELAGEEAESLLSSIEAVIEEKKHAPVQDEDGDEEAAYEELSAELPITVIDGNECVGYIEIPLLELRLPVMAEASYSKLKISPCRQTGSSRTDDLVIAAHNYSTHFGKLSRLITGDTVTFTDMDGIENTYEVAAIEKVDPYSVEYVINSGCDLVLYTCTESGAERVVVFCNRA